MPRKLILRGFDLCNAAHYRTSTNIMLLRALCECVVFVVIAMKYHESKRETHMQKLAELGQAHNYRLCFV